jgi:hypothetical protein
MRSRNTDEHQSWLEKQPPAFLLLRCKKTSLAAFGAGLDRVPAQHTLGQPRFLDSRAGDKLRASATSRYQKIDPGPLAMRGPPIAIP